ncbi:MAG: flagellar hook-length control protein FliK [Clostridiales bacterium]|nr:flagellar hook-length control protein FliK [Clostridiales bacterium]
MTANGISNNSGALLVRNNSNTMKTSEKKESSFKSMFEKNTKDTKTDKESVEHTLDEMNESTASKNEDMQEEQTKVAQALAQYVAVSQQERASINWGVLTDELANPQISTEATEGFATVQQVGTDHIVMDSSSTNGFQNTNAQIQNSLAAQQSEVGNKDQIIPEQPKVDKHDQATNSTGDLKAQKDRSGIDSNFVQSAVKGENTQNSVISEKKVTVEQQLSQNTNGATATESTVVFENTSKTNFNNDEVINVKVGDSIDILSQKAEKDLADIILLKDMSKNNEFEIQLKPEELGKIKIKLVFDDGKVNVTMFCENQKAADLLSATSSKLGALIENRTGNETNVFVQHERQQQLFDDGGQRQNNHGNEGNSRQGKDKNNKDDITDFIQQIRLGLADIS